MRLNMLLFNNRYNASNFQPAKNISDTIRVKIEKEDSDSEQAYETYNVAVSSKAKNSPKIVPESDANSKKVVRSKILDDSHNNKLLGEYMAGKKILNIYKCDAMSESADDDSKTLVPSKIIDDDSQNSKLLGEFVATKKILNTVTFELNKLKTSEKQLKEELNLKADENEKLRAAMAAVLASDKRAETKTNAQEKCQVSKTSKNTAKQHRCKRQLKLKVLRPIITNFCIWCR